VSGWARPSAGSPQQRVGSSPAPGAEPSRSGSPRTRSACAAGGSRRAARVPHCRCASRPGRQRRWQEADAL